MGVALVLAAAPSASAGTDATSSITGSWSRFISGGDHFENCDTDDDGLTSYIQFRYTRIDGSLQNGSHYNPGSAGDCTTWNHNFGEGRPVYFRSCVDNLAWLEDKCDPSWRKGTA
ncbi:hypothetical protein ACWFQ8_33515 [Streptomyces sp. NPDC055254]